MAGPGRVIVAARCCTRSAAAGALPLGRPLMKPTPTWIFFAGGLQAIPCITGRPARAMCIQTRRCVGSWPLGALPLLASRPSQSGGLAMRPRPSPLAPPAFLRTSHARSTQRRSASPCQAGGAAVCKAKFDRRSIRMQAEYQSPALQELQRPLLSLFSEQVGGSGAGRRRRDRRGEVWAHGVAARLRRRWGVHQLALYAA